MPWHRPRFRLVHLMALVDVEAVEFSTLPQPLSWIMAGLSFSSALVASLLGPVTKIELFGIIVIHYDVYCLLAPWIASLHRCR